MKVCKSYCRNDIINGSPLQHASTHDETAEGNPLALQISRLATSCSLDKERTDGEMDVAVTLSGVEDGSGDEGPFGCFENYEIVIN